MDEVEVIIVGSGVIGLAIAAELAKNNREVYVIEAKPSFGQETSSRNSEVIHAGIYYPKNSLKSITCLEGKNLLYEFCEKRNIAYKRIGKLIIAKDNSEKGRLEQLFNHAKSCGVEDLSLIQDRKIGELEPNLKAQLAIYSGSTGIIDSHSLMKSLQEEAKARAAEFLYNARVKNIHKEKCGFKVEIIDSDGEDVCVHSKIVVNSAGLNSDKVSGMLGINDESYQLKYCKGEYFRISSQKSKLRNRLVYPVPDIKGRDLGIHLTPDLTGSLRLGPDAFYVDKNVIDYSFDSSKKHFFCEQGRKFIPSLSDEDLSEDITGIRPKLQGPQDEFRDFIIKHENDRGLVGFINLLGIESPGLTACLSIAKIVNKEIEGII